MEPTRTSRGDGDDTAIACRTPGGVEPTRTSRGDGDDNIL